jgi:hypothetical membrane protein
MNSSKASCSGFGLITHMLSLWKCIYIICYSPECVEGRYPEVGYPYAPADILHMGDALPDTSGVNYLPNDVRTGHIGSALHPRAKEKPMSNQRSVVGVSSAQSLEGHPSLSALALAGIAGPIIFAVVALMHSLLREDHSLWEHPISALAAGPSGWIQNVNFLLFGSLMIAYAIGLHLGVRSSRWGLVGVGFLVLSGIGLMWGGLFPATDATGSFDEDRLLHIPGFIMTFLGGGIGLIVMSRRMARDPRWKSLSTYALLSGIAMLVLIVVGGALVRPPGSPLHAWFGLFQWVLLAVWLPCAVVLALRLLRLTRVVEGPR